MKTVKSQRLTARISPEEKELLEAAAQLHGLSVSDFVVSEMTKLSRRIVAEERKVQLSAEGAMRLRKLLAAPGGKRPAKLASAQAKLGKTLKISVDTTYDSNLQSITKSNS